MKTWLRHFLPFGLVRANQLASEFERIGLPRGSALQRDANRRLQYLNLDLLPSGALSGAPGMVVDVGANVGDWTATLLSFYRPAKLICVEPDPRLALHLRQRFAGNDIVTVSEHAVGSAPGKAQLNVMEDSVFNSLRKPVESVQGLYPASFRVTKTVDVEVRTLDSLLAGGGSIKLLKIDVQGFEREVLAGAKEVLARTNFVLMEANFQPHYEGEAGFHELQELMRAHGFSLSNYSKPKGSRGQALYADVLYVRGS
jgi:FkbM family methyltransferase